LAAAGDAGWGVGQTLTARGVLTHAIHVVDGKVARYQVQAPTDSFFADAAPLTGLLAHREFPSRERARQALEQAILALDPCLPYNVELHDA
jgi:coenzyme F420-reducing hydrogenase alpha subunit